MSATARVVIDKAIENNKVMVFSKTYCPYCAKTKSTLKELGIEHSVLELDVRALVRSCSVQP
jgi:thioredoxin-related protein